MKKTVICVAQRGRNPDRPTSRESGLPTVQMIEPNWEGTTNTITTVCKDNLILIVDIPYEQFRKEWENGVRAYRKAHAVRRTRNGRNER